VRGSVVRARATGYRDGGLPGPRSTGPAAGPGLSVPSGDGPGRAGEVIQQGPSLPRPRLEPRPRPSVRIVPAGAAQAVSGRSSAGPSGVGDSSSRLKGAGK